MFLHFPSFIPSDLSPCQVGVKKGKTMEGKVDPNAVNGGKIRETKGELYLKLLQKPKADKKGKRQSSKQEPDKVAKENS